ncbi:glycosyltransferase [Lachnospiraceae bacterium SGI.085]
MKIFIIHNYHRKGSASGDDQVVKSETRLLESYGNEVISYSKKNDEFDNKGIVGKICSTLQMLWNFSAYKDVKKIILENAPDIVHVHTFFPLMSPSVLYAAKRTGCKVVATLHDTRFICPCATSLRKDEICNKCGDGKYFRMVKYGCFKKSRLQSLIVAIIFYYHRSRKSFYKQIDRYICLNNSQIELLTEVGFDKHKIIKKYNFVSDVSKICNKKKTMLPDKYVVFYGRIGEEKGIRVLMRIWDEIDDIPIVVMGDGPLSNEFRQWSQNKDNVIYLGYTEREECLAIVQQCEFVVFPSIWYEGCSMVEIETQSLGKCIIATDLGFSKETITDGVNGFKIELNNKKAFLDKIRYLWENHEKCMEMGRNARKTYENNYTEEENYNQLMKCYKGLIEEE